MSNRLIKDVIAKQKPLIATRSMTVAAAARVMKKHHVGAIMVVDADRLVGICTERDVLYRVVAEARNPATTEIGDVMTARPRTVNADMRVGHALLLMYDGRFRHVPVLDGGRPVGMISARDALGPELQEFKDDLEQRDHFGEVMR